MEYKKIKTDLAAISRNSKGEFVVCLKIKTSTKCFYFDNINQIKETLEAKQITARKWMIAVSTENCICKELSLPANNIEEAVKMVEFELESILPLPANQVVYGCSAISSTSNMVTLMVHIIKLNMLEQICSFYKEIGIAPKKISVDNAAINCWFNKRRKISPANIDILIDLNIAIVLFSRQGNLQNSQIIKLKNENNHYIAEKIEEAIISINENLLDTKNDSSSVTIAGDSIKIDELKNILKNKQNDLSIKEIFTLQAPKPDSLADSKNNNKIRKSCLPAVLATGLIESTEDDKLKHLDLIPQYQRNKERKTKLIINNLVITAFTIMLSISLWLCLQAMIWRVEKKCELIKAEISPIEHIADTVESKRQKLKAIQKQFSGRGTISQIFHDLYSFSPANISISQLNFKSKTDSATIDIKGQSDSLSDAFEYADSMEQAKLLKNINIINVQQSPVAGGSIVEFKANCIIRSN